MSVTEFVGDDGKLAASSPTYVDWDNLPNHGLMDTTRKSSDVCLLYCEDPCQRYWWRVQDSQPDAGEELPA